MRRREFIAFLAMWIGFLGTAKARNSTGRLRRIGFLSGIRPLNESVASFEQGLREAGWQPGQNIVIEYRFGAGRFDRLPGLATELAASGVELIVAVSAPETRAAKEGTKGTIPIVFAIHGDPIGTGDIQSLANPGGMLTGLCQMHPELSRKQLELLKECVPAVSSVAVLWNASNPAKANDWKEINSAARLLDLALQSHELRNPADLDGILTTLKNERPDALLVLGDPVTVTLREAIVQFATVQRLPGMYPFRQFADAGGLISYGADINDLFRRVGGYVDKILNGAKPGDLPVEQPTKFELVINLKTAKTIGLNVPPTVLARADEVIE
jgi:putative ABC transport system substrate-binding protein